MMSARRVLSLLLSLACSSALERSSLTRPVAPLASRSSISRTSLTTPLLLAANPPQPAAPSASGLAVGWAVFGMIGILGNAVKRLAPIAIQPLKAKDLSMFQWGAYIGTILFFAYAEGYKAFQLKFSPLVVRRAMTLKEPTAKAVDVVLAPFYSMGLFHATRKRKIVSWSVSTAVLLIVGVVKRMPYPWRSIVDAGVVMGLTWGSISMAVIYIKALTGTPPTIDPQIGS